MKKILLILIVNVLISGAAFQATAMSDFAELNFSQGSAAKPFTSPEPTEYYVSVGGSDTNDGLSRETPFKTITRTLEKAHGTAEIPAIINLAMGTYSPSTNGEIFPLILEAHTTLSGESGLRTIIDAGQTGSVFRAVGVTSVILETLAIQNGADLYGSGLYCESAVCQVNNCLFMGHVGRAVYMRESSNTFMGCMFSNGGTQEPGGGVYCLNSDLKTHECQFIGNDIDSNGGALSTNASTINISSCCFRSNRGDFGGGIFADSGSAVAISDSKFTDNLARFSGGGLVVRHDSWVGLTNCLIADNHANLHSGGIGADFESAIYAYNCTIVDNSCDSELFSSGITVLGGTQLIVRDSIVRGNTNGQIEYDDYCSVTFSNIGGGFPGESNIDADPRFQAGPQGFYYLVKEGSRSAGSPCIDAGSRPASAVCYEILSGSVCISERTTSIDGTVDSDKVDIGFHYLRDATPTPSSTPAPTAPPSPALTVTLDMPDYVSPGDPFYVKARIENPDHGLSQVPFCCLLQIGRDAWFWPEWSKNKLDFYTINFPQGTTSVTIVPVTDWPDTGTDFMSGFQFFSAVLLPDFSDINGDFDMVDFGFGPQH